MAFEVATKKEIRKLNWLNLVFYFSLILLLAAISSYFVLTYYLEETSSKITDLDKNITTQEKENNELITYLKGEEKLINDFSKIINEHKFTYQIFEAVEKITHPEIILKDFNFNPEGLVLSVSGTTTNFQALGQQSIILQEERSKPDSKEKIVIDFSLNTISYREGYIDFTLEIFLAPQVFNFKPQS